MKTVLITGTTQGIGAALKKMFLDKGFFVIGTRLDADVRDDAQCKEYYLDLQNKESIDTFANEIEVQSIDLLINNAGVLLEEDNSFDEKIFLQTLQINLIGTTLLTEQLLKRCAIKQIITITSDWGSFSDQDFSADYPAYKISKAALNMYTKILAARLDEKNILVSAVDPGWVQTAMGGNEAYISPAQAAEDICYVANVHKNTGLFWRYRKIRDW